MFRCFVKLVCILERYCNIRSAGDSYWWGKHNLFGDLCCYAMLCYAMLCYAMPCYAMLCYIMLCFAMLFCNSTFMPQENIYFIKHVLLILDLRVLLHHKYLKGGYSGQPVIHTIGAFFSIVGVLSKDKKCAPD